jgi:hypothetical protein
MNILLVDLHNLPSNEFHKFDQQNQNSLLTEYEKNTLIG